MIAKRDTKTIRSLAAKMNIRVDSEWSRVSPAEILAKPGVAEKTLDKLRLHLADRGLTLRDDRTPDFWQANLRDKKSYACPFTIIVDNQEKHPFTFGGITTSAKQGNRPLIVSTERRSLGPSHGDYSMLGFEGEIHIERKSMDDAHGTILGWGERRERFANTLEYLDSIPFGAVVIECTLGQLLVNAPEHGRKTAEENKAAINASYLSYLLRYSAVKWIFCDSPRLAEIETFRLLERFYFRQLRRRKQAEKQSKSLQLSSI